MTVANQTVSSAPTRPRHRWMIPAGFVWAMSVLLWVITDGLFSRSEQTQVIWLATILTALGLLGAAAMAGELDILTALARLKLGPWMALGFSLGFGLATLAWLGDIPGYLGIVTRAWLAPAGTMAGAGFLALVVGYCSTPRLLRNWGSKVDRRLRGHGVFSPGAWSVWTLWGLGVSAQAINFQRGSFGYLSDPRAALATTSSVDSVLFAITQLGLLATVVSGWRFSGRRRPGPMILLMWVAGSQMVLGLFGGTKEAAVIQLVAIVVGFSARGRLRLGPLMAAGLIMSFVVAPFVTTYRAAVLQGSGRMSPAESLRTIDFFQMISGSTTQNAHGEGLADSTARWSLIGDVAIIVGKTPTPIGYRSPAELVSGPVLGFVPRSIWPGKPVLDAGYEINQEYYGAPGAIYSSSAVTPYGDLYRHGGVGIVIAGMAILGMFVRTVDDRRGASIGIDPCLLFLPMVLFTTMVKQEMDYLGLTASLVISILEAALAVRIVSRGATPN